MIVTRIVYSKNLTESKFTRLTEIASRLGKFRTMVRDKYGSIQGMRVNSNLEPVKDRKTGEVKMKRKDMFTAIRDKWVREKSQFHSLPPDLWKETLRDECGNIEAQRAAAIESVKSCIRRKLSGLPEAEYKKSFRELLAKFKDSSFLEDKWLSAKFRKYFYRGHTTVANQLVFNYTMYSWFTHKGQGWLSLKITGTKDRINIPLCTDDKHPIAGTIRLILRNGKVEVHYTIEIDIEKNKVDRPVGQLEVGIDKGYTEAFIDSTGEVFGDGIGKILTNASNSRNEKGKLRNKLRSIAYGGKPQGKGNNQPTKPQVIANNLGKKKWNKREQHTKNQLRDVLYKASHSLFDKSGNVACEKLSGNFFKKDKKSLPPSVNRKLSNWNRGQIKQILNLVSQKRSAFLVEVNPAYTSQACSVCGCLGSRKSDKFHCTNKKCGVVLQADYNGAVNVLHRKGDPEIGLYTPYRKVKEILIERQSAIGGGTAASKTPTLVQISLFGESD